MKLVRLITTGEGAEQINARDIIKAITKAMPEGGDLEEIMKRTRILKAIDATKDTNLILEDADHAKLVDLVKKFKFGAATIEIAEVLNEVLQAKEPPSVMQPAVNGVAV